MLRLGVTSHMRASWSSHCFHRHQDRMRRLAITSTIADVKI